MRLAHGFPATASAWVSRVVAPNSHPCAGPAGASSGLFTPWRPRPLGSSPSLVHVMTSGIPARLRGTRPSATPASLLPFSIAFHLRSLPSAGITRLPRHLRTSPPPCRPDLTLAGCRLACAAPPAGLPVLRPIPSSTHATANTPAEPVGARVARFPTAGSLPHFNGGSASAVRVSRPARRSLALWPVWSLSRPRRPVASECFRRCCCLHHPLRLLPTGATVAGRDSHPLRTGAFSRRTLRYTLRTVIDIDLPTSPRRSLSFAAWHAWDAARLFPSVS